MRLLSLYYGNALTNMSLNFAFVLYLLSFKRFPYVRSNAFVLYVNIVCEISASERDDLTENVFL